MAIHSAVDVEISSGGSGTGLKNVAAGTVDIGDSDVYAAEKLDASTAETLVDHKVATIGVAAVVNKDVAATVTNVTTAQLISIFTGATTNWSTLGGPNETIVRCTRPTSSGTRTLFEKYAMSGTAEVSDANGLESDNSGDLYAKVQETKGAIGYLALSYLVSNTNVGILSFNGTAASYTNIYSGAYPVWGFEHMYTLGAGSVPAQAFIAYITSDAYSGYIEQQGYGVNSKMSAAATSGR
jgi:phosphate transport system substrate-binding protein